MNPPGKAGTHNARFVELQLLGKGGPRAVLLLFTDAQENKNMDKTAIMIILDESPSMSSARDETIKGFNLFLTEQKKETKPATLSLVKFHGQYSVVYMDKPINEVEELTPRTYAPGGSGTALFDSVGRGILELGAKLANLPEAERPDKVLFVIITDGEENMSRELSRNDIQRMVKEQTEKYSWTFLFMGADIDAYQGAASLGIAPSHAAQYLKGSTEDAYRGLSNMTSRSRDGSGPLSRSAGFSKEDKNLIEKKGDSKSES